MSDCIIDIVIEEHLPEVVEVVVEERTPEVIVVEFSENRGSPGRTPVLSSTKTHIIWKYSDEPDSAYRELAPISSIGSINLICGEDISRGQTVAIQNGKAVVGNIEWAREVVGIAESSALEGEEITIVNAGQIEVDGWDLIEGKAYVGINGAISNTEPVVGYVMRVGYAVNSTTLIVQLYEPKLLENDYVLLQFPDGIYDNSLIYDNNLIY